MKTLKTLKTLRSIAVAALLLSIPAIAGAGFYADSKMAEAKAESQKILSEAKEKFEKEKEALQEAAKS